MSHYIIFFLHFGLTPYHGGEACVFQEPSKLCRLGLLPLAGLTMPDWSKGRGLTKSSPDWGLGCELITRSWKKKPITGTGISIASLSYCGAYCGPTRSVRSKE